MSILAGLAIALSLAGDAVARDRSYPPPRKARTAAIKSAAIKNPRAATNRPANTRAADAPGPEGTRLNTPSLGTTNRFGAAGALHRPFTSPAAFRQDYERHRVEHKAALLAARSRLPQRPMPGERGFTGVPPAGETRFISNEMVFHVAPNVSRQTVDSVARKLGLSTVDSHNVALTGGTLFRFRVADGRGVADAVRALEAEKIGVAQPNYVYKLQQDPTLAARTKSGDLGQYVVNKLHLG